MGGAHSAAGARSSPPASSRRRGPRRAGCWPRRSRSSRAACPSSGSSRPASSPCATSCRRCCPARRRMRSRAKRCSSRSCWRARRRPAASRSPSRATPARSCCTATATRKRSGPWTRSRRRWGSWRASRSRRWSSSCCGMAGAFGYGADTHEASLAMGELSLLPAVRRAPAGRDHCRRRLLLPPPDPRRHRPHPAARRAHPAPGHGRGHRNATPLTIDAIATFGGLAPRGRPRGGQVGSPPIANNHCPCDGGGPRKMRGRDHDHPSAP